MEEKKLIEELKKRKEEAYHILLHTYGDKLLKTCYLMVNNEKDAEDIVQETFIRVFKYIKGFKGNSSLYTWIYRIANNVTKDMLKASIPTIPYEDYYEISDDLEDSILLDIDKGILRIGLYELNFIYRQVLILFYFEDLSIKEICQVLGEKEGTIKSRLSRGRVELRNILVKGRDLDER